MATNKLQLKAGGKYRTREGRIAEVTGEDFDVPFDSSARWDGRIEGHVCSWRFDGCFLHDDNHGRDLVEEIVETPELSLEVGKKYRTRHGREVLIETADLDPEDPFPFAGSIDDLQLTWKPDGTFFDYRPRAWDLVSEIIEPRYRYFRWKDSCEFFWRASPDGSSETTFREPQPRVWERALSTLDILLEDPGIAECSEDGSLLEPDPVVDTVAFKTTEDLTPEHRTRIAKLAARIVLADGPILTVDELAGMTVGELVTQLEDITDIYSI